jgi:hypothetical protein
MRFGFQLSRSVVLAMPLTVFAVGAVLAVDVSTASAQPVQVPGAPPLHPPDVAAVRHATGLTAAAQIPAPKAPVLVHSPAEIALMEQHLREYNAATADVKHAFVAEAGHRIDCVDVQKQPALRAPQLRGHVLGVPPSAFAAASAEPGHAGSPPAAGVPLPPPGVPQATGNLLKGGRDAAGALRECPVGTVPVTHHTLDTLKAFATLGDFYAKYPGGVDAGRRFAVRDAAAKGAPPPLPPPGEVTHDHAGASNGNLVNYGAHSTLRVVHPYVMHGYNEFSLSQIWVTAGAYEDKSLQTLEIGVQASPDHHGGDARPRMFVYSTSDAYQFHNGSYAQAHASGCYNLQCGRFVQIANNWDWDAPVNAGEVDVAFIKYADKWWLQVGSTWVGYYPAALYNAKGIRDRATSIDFGGEIVDNRDASVGGHPTWHTMTAMGSGAWPTVVGAAYQKRLSYFGQANGQAHYHAWGLTGYAERPTCYASGGPQYNYADANSGAFFFFGGPGYSWTCAK